MQLLELTEAYILERNVSKSTAIHYRFVSNLFVKDTGVSDVGNLSKEFISRWREMVMSRETSPVTWNNYLRHLKVILAYGVKNELIQQSPDVSLMRAPNRKELPKIITFEDLEKVMNYLASKESRFKPKWFWLSLLRGLYYTGMRRRQLALLQWKDIDFVGQKIHMSVKSSKNYRSWDIPMSLQMNIVMTKMKKQTLNVLECEENELAERYVYDISLFNSNYKQENYISEKAISNFFTRVSKATGVSISSHKLRHTMATNLAQQCMYKELQELLGHSCVSMTMRYVHPQIEQMRKMLDSLRIIL